MTVLRHPTFLPQSVPGAPGLEVLELQAMGSLRRIDPGDVLIREGRPPSCLFVLRHGLLVARGTVPTGRLVTVALLGPGDVAGEAALNPPDRPDDPGPAPGRQLEVRAVCPSEVVVVHPMSLWAGSSTRAMRLVCAALARQLERAHGDLSAALGLPVPDRVRRTLATLAAVAGRAVPGGIRITVPVTQDALADLVGATRESVNRALARLRAAGFVRWSGRTYTVSADPSPVP